MPVSSLRNRLKQLIARAMRPALAPIEDRLTRIESRLTTLEAAHPDRDKFREELAYWRWLIKTDEGRKSLYAPFEAAFGNWQRERLLELGRALRLDGESALDAWCHARSAVEIGAGPYPALAAAKDGWRRAVAVDPLARAYTEEGLLPAAAASITYLDSPGERIPLPRGFADLVIIENALDHVSDPAAVLDEIRRLLAPGGYLWLLVDLSTHTDHMHPHPFNEPRIRTLLAAAGFEAISDRVSDHRSHPKAYGEYRGLLRTLAPISTAVGSVSEAKPVVRSAQP